MIPSKRNLVMPTDEEDAATKRGIAADPDTHELTDAELQQLRPMREWLAIHRVTSTTTPS